MRLTLLGNTGQRTQQCALCASQMARCLLPSPVMRSILILFTLAALGFGFILQKKDPPEPVTAKTTASGPGTGRTNLMKRAPEKGRSVAQNASAIRAGNEL